MHSARYLLALAPPVVAACLAAGTAVAGAPPDDTFTPTDADAQARAEAAVAAFGEAATAAGYVSDEWVDDSVDLFDVVDEEGDEAPIVACFDDLRTHLAPSGSFIGQTALARSATFEVGGYGTATAAAAEAMPVTVAPSGLRGVGGTAPAADGSYRSVTAAVAVVDDASRGELVAVVESLDDDALGDCFQDAYNTLIEENAQEGVEFEMAFESEGYDRGDESVILRVSLRVTSDERNETVDNGYAVVVVGNAVAIAEFEFENAELDDSLDAVVTAMVESLSG